MSDNEKTVADRYALPARVRDALARVDQTGADAPVTGKVWSDLATVAKVDRVGTALVNQGLGKRPVVLDNGESVNGVTALSRALGFTGHATVSHWTTALGWLQDSDTIVTADLHSAALTAYNGGKVYRDTVVAEGLQTIKAMTGQGARAERWTEIGAGAAAARVAADADRKQKSQKVDDESADVDTRAPQVNDGADTVTTFEDWFADLQRLASVVVTGDGTAPFALTNDRVDAVRGLLASIAEATVGTLTSA